MTVFGGMFVPADVRAAVSDAAWLAAMLDAERALVNAEASAGVVPAHLAGPVAERCRPELFDTDELAALGRASANPVEPMVRRLRELVGEPAAGYVHWGATSQDILDTAAMLVARRVLHLLDARLGAAAGELAALAERHRSTPMAARTLLQQAVPTTFGCKCAGWLTAVLDNRARLRDLRHRLRAQLGGAAGTLAALGEDGPAVVRLYARELDLAEPAVPWHADRTAVAELGAALAICAGALAKIGYDLVLLSQTEVAEVAEAEGGRSSTMPHKRNPVASTLAVACARGACAEASVLVGAMVAEHERAAGGWQAEWSALSGALALTAGAADALARALHGLDVDAGRMRRNLDATGGLIMAESVAFALAPDLGLLAAQELVSAAAARAGAGPGTFRDELEADPRVREAADSGRLEAALDPDRYLGSAQALVDRALERHRAEPA